VVFKDRTLIPLGKAAQKSLFEMMLKDVPKDKIVKVFERNGLKDLENTKINLTLKVADGGHMSSKITTVFKAIDQLSKVYKRNVDNYNSPLITGAFLRVFHDRPTHPIQYMVQGGRHIIDMNATYFVVSP
jgi:hypothetical protein